MRFTQLAQVVNNLVANAINYTPTGKVRVSIHLDVERRQVCLQVHNTGIGVDSQVGEGSTFRVWLPLWVEGDML